MIPIEKMRQEIKRFGLARGMLYTLDRVANKILMVDCLHVIRLDREQLHPPKENDDYKLSYRFADENDLMEMHAKPEWDIGEAKLQHFKEGDKCLLVYYDSELAGYTWVHLDGRPLLLPGLRISVPSEYAYNYAGFTLPKFRGKKLQSLRHYSLLNQDELLNRKGLVGYVKYNNWSSKKGQSKSGYYSIGRIWLFGTKKKYLAPLSGNLKRIGIRRIKA